MPYNAAADRYERLDYRRCGRSGLKLPAISLGLWQNFGGADVFETGRAVLRRAFDRGVTHFDLANNYGPPPGSAEEKFGRYMAADFKPYRDELVISTKAGYDMWPGPYGSWGSRKYLVASLDQSLQAHGARLCRYLLLAPGRSRHSAGRDHGRAGPGRPAGQGAVCRHLLLLAGEDAAGGRDPELARHALPDPSAVLFDAEPVDRGRSARHAGRAGHRLHRLLGLGAGHADVEVPERHSGRLAGDARRHR